MNNDKKEKKFSPSITSVRFFGADMYGENENENQDDYESVSGIIDSEYNTILELKDKAYDNMLKDLSSTDIHEYTKSGFSALDQHIESFIPGSLSFIAARSSVGKSAFALNIAINILAANKRVMFITLEASTLEVVQRIMSLKLKIPYIELRSRKINQEDWQKIKEESKKEYLENLYLYDINTDSLEKINRAIFKEQPDIVIIDHLNLIELPESMDIYESKKAIISRQLKLMAMKHDIPFLVLSQLNGEYETMSDKEVKFSDLRDSGSIEQDADLIMFLTDAKNIDKYIDNAEVKSIKLTIVKNRHGKKDASMIFGFQGQYMKFFIIRRRPPKSYRVKTR